MKYRIFCAAIAVCTLAAPGRRGAAQEEFPFQIFDRYLAPLVQQIGMPGLSAVIVQNGRVAWKNNYGFADVEKGIRAEFDTPYAVGGITQALTGILVGVCIDRYRLEIDDGIRAIVPSFPVDTTTRAVLSHATGSRFRYDPSLYSGLTSVVESPKCFNQSYRQAAAAEVLDKLAMKRSVPGLDLNRADGVAARDLFDEDTVKRYQSVLADVAKPYRLDEKGRSFPSEFPSFGMDASSGLVTTAEDLYKLEAALDNESVPVPLSSSTLNKMWSNTVVKVVNNGQEQSVVMPTGLGWFVTTESGQRLVWTFGHIPNAGSALIVRITGCSSNCSNLPQKRLTLILLANSGGLAQGYDLENAHVTSSPFVKIFLRLFI